MCLAIMQILFCGESSPGYRQLKTIILHLSGEHALAKVHGCKSEIDHFMGQQQTDILVFEKYDEDGELDGLLRYCAMRYAHTRILLITYKQLDACLHYQLDGQVDLVLKSPVDPTLLHAFLTWVQCNSTASTDSSFERFNSQVFATLPPNFLRYDGSVRLILVQVFEDVRSEFLNFLLSRLNEAGQCEIFHIEKCVGILVSAPLKFQVVDLLDSVFQQFQKRKKEFTWRCAI